MREILYKGKRVDNGEWVYGLPFLYCASQIGIAKFDNKADITSSKENEFSRWDIFNLFVPKVNRETVCQYTGINDVNGKRIFESDLIKIDKLEEPLLVVYDEDDARFILKYSTFIFSFETLMGGKIEVVGNKFDSQEFIL